MTEAATAPSETQLSREDIITQRVIAYLTGRNVEFSEDRKRVIFSELNKANAEDFLLTLYRTKIIGNKNMNGTTTKLHWGQERVHGRMFEYVGEIHLPDVPNNTDAIVFENDCLSIARESIDENAPFAQGSLAHGYRDGHNKYLIALAGEQQLEEGLSKVFEKAKWLQGFSHDLTKNITYSPSFVATNPAEAQMAWVEFVDEVTEIQNEIVKLMHDAGIPDLLGEPEKATEEVSKATKGVMNIPAARFV
ncbi:MAG: hypothetical protein DHS20C02_04930 [Micavibrio sp.]|nr:MAG: hypothetical protein DHS20C02_04930 [Micavibrio sp.]